MFYDEDYQLALKLQDELNAVEENLQPNKRKHDELNLNATQNIVHPEWEAVDPTPDIYSLFGAFDIKFFQGKLKCVELEWSKRMYQCAGICYQRRNRLGISIIIRLSEPLLKLRSRRNLIETLLHEMIHAYLFVLNIREGNGGHGPNFVKIMTNINRTTGTNITVYHSFFEEVAFYKTHVWRCNGICQHRKPFFGWVKRTSNRAPGPNDLWWAKHQESCSGCFQKVSQPEPVVKAKKTKVSNDTIPKITNWLNKPGNIGTKPTKRNAGGYTKMNGGNGSATVVVKPTTQNRKKVTATDNRSNTITNSSFIPTSPIGGNLSNVVGFRDLNDSGSQVAKKPSNHYPSGNGHTLGSNANVNSFLSKNLSPTESVRSIWANKFISTAQETPIALNDPIPKDKSRVQKNSKSGNEAKVTETKSSWETIDDDLLVQEVEHTVIKISDDDESDGENNMPTILKKEKPQISQISIRQELMDDLGDNGDVIELIDDEYNDELHDESLLLLTDTSVIDDIFGTDTLMTDFNDINNVIMNDPENKGNPDREIITCPICQERLQREQFSEHLDGCAGITIKIDHKKRGASNNPFYKNQVKASTSRKANEMDRENLRKAGYDQSVIDRVLSETAEEKEYNQRIFDEIADDNRQKQAIQSIQSTSFETILVDESDNNADENSPLHQDRHQCPVCNAFVDAKWINEHLDSCLQGSDDE